VDDAAQTIPAQKARVRGCQRRLAPWVRWRETALDVAGACCSGPRTHRGSAQGAAGSESAACDCCKVVLVAAVDVAVDGGYAFPDDLSPSFAPSNPTRMGAFARCAPARGSGATPPTAGASPGAVSATPADGGGPPPVGMAGTGLEQLANRTCHRQTGDSSRLAPPRLPPVLDVEGPPADRSADRALRCARADSDDVAGQPALGRSPDPRRIAETGVLTSVRRPSRNTWSAFGTRRPRRGARSWRITSGR
jgi:hypothetical protein